MDFKYALNPMWARRKKNWYYGTVAFLCTQAPCFTLCRFCNRIWALAKWLDHEVQRADLWPQGMCWIYEWSIWSVRHLKKFVTWGTWWGWCWRPAVGSTAAGVWAGADITILYWVTVMPTVTIRTRPRQIRVVVNRSIGCSIKCWSPVITTGWTTGFWAAFCKWSKNQIFQNFK